MARWRARREVAGAIPHGVEYGRRWTLVAAKDQELEVHPPGGRLGRVCFRRVAVGPFHRSVIMRQFHADHASAGTTRTGPNSTTMPAPMFAPLTAAVMTR
jgi:hypothetical protein